MDPPSERTWGTDESLELLGESQTFGGKFCKFTFFHFL